LELKRCGKAIHTHNFIAVLGEGSQPTTRIGITITKHVGCAVTRNKIKRIVRDYFRLNKQILPSTLDVNIIAKNRAAQRHSTELRSDLHRLFVAVTRRYHH
jgi:ribonuclease P protein component